jgi:hypothetical protein
VLTSKRQIDPAIRRRLKALPEALVEAKMEAIARATSLADEDRLEPIGEDLQAPSAKQRCSPLRIITSDV